MVKIQILFLFTSINKLTLEQRTRVKEIVCEEYETVFQCGISNIQAELQDASSKTNKQDIILAIVTDKHVFNEGAKRGRVKEAIATRLERLPYMKKLGFEGVLGLLDGEVQGESEQTLEENGKKDKDIADNVDYRTRAKQYQASEAKHSFERLIISQKILEQIETALGRIEYERKVFEEWGLYAIMPNPVSAMSFYGPPGTGKSMAADAIANKLGRKIIRASYADIENKYVGEGPKNISAIFLAAEEQNAVLFIDEADSLLSKRMVNVSEPSGQAMNSMRSQLLISLENFHGIVIFATNLAANYDKAFVSRLINIEFEFPDAQLRKKIWISHLYPTEGSKVKLNIPLAADINLDEIAEKYVLCGRDIRNAVVNACVMVCMAEKTEVAHADICKAAEQIIEDNKKMENASDYTKLKENMQTTAKEVDVSMEVKQMLADGMNKQLEEKRDKEKECNEE
ncbi:MAG: AAA family ATPase [Roseburia sp.]|nr:AAA family ATPase [Roseburia sp.]